MAAAASLSTTTPGVPLFPPLISTRRTASTRVQVSPRPDSEPSSSPSSTALTVVDERTRRIARELDELKRREAKERKELRDRKVASQKAVSVILWREATKAVIDKSGRKKKGPINSKKLLPRTVLEALHERVAALRWESALKVYQLSFLLLFYVGFAGLFYVVTLY
ncbi:hypothetical protein LR48_Vigan03g129400 [Vigna angularis]|uniref:Uncharacterized protein n=1 Tax=Phaseolus angularis TaxID=3914 RepID=A0A0L9U5E9_PHAAN|nr:hypothetical protein LR48_Vigan03g129400 [Vigna angularis]